MKKALILAAMIFSTTLGALAYDFTPVGDNQIIHYSPDLKTWSDGIVTSEDSMEFMKKMSIGSGGFSEYYYADGTLANQIGSNFEFITLDGRLIACHNAELKLFEMHVLFVPMKCSSLHVLHETPSKHVLHSGKQS